MKRFAIADWRLPIEYFASFAVLCVFALSINRLIKTPKEYQSAIGNRKLQIGNVIMPNLSYISPKAEAKESAIQGRGLFAVEPIEKGEIVCVKGGYIFNGATLERVSKSLGPSEVQISEQFFIGPLSEQEREGSMIFSNHSCEPNIGIQGQIVFVAMRDIQAGEELTHDWATTDDDTYEMECKCGTPSCRKLVSGQDWRRKDLQEKYAGYMSWYLVDKIRRMA